MRWRQTISPARRLKEYAVSWKKIVDTIFWNEKDVILVNILPTVTTVNHDQYIGTLKILNASLRLR
jgi:Transposase.